MGIIIVVQPRPNGVGGFSQAIHMVTLTPLARTLFLTQLFFSGFRVYRLRGQYQGPCPENQGVSKTTFAQITFLYLGSFTETRFNPLELRPPTFNFSDLRLAFGKIPRLWGLIFSEVYAIKSGDYILRPLVRCRICIFLNTFLQSNSFCRNMKRRAGEAGEGPSNKVTLSDDHQS